MLDAGPVSTHLLSVHIFAIMVFGTHYLINLLQVFLLLLQPVYADTAVTVTTYAQPLPCFGFCLALDPGIIRRDDGVSDISKTLKFNHIVLE